MVVSCLNVTVVKAEETQSFTLNSEVTDAGEYIYQVVIEYENFKPTPAEVDASTYKVVASGSSSKFVSNPAEESYGDYKDITRTVVSTKVEGSKVILTLLEAENGSSTLAYLKAGRNVPLDLTYTVVQEKDINGTTTDGRSMALSKDTVYTWDKVVHNTETAKFISVSDEINYQLYIPEGDDQNSGERPLIVWFHGNGEGDYNYSGNNVAQMLANRGTVAWATDEAQNAFGGAYVMAFQAPDTWYYAQRDNLLEKAYNEIQNVIATYNLDSSRVYAAGCSAGGYMTTRMIIAYPDLFAAANIICPALDVATDRGGQTPIDEELLTLKDAQTKIWLVQADDDTVVKTKDCADRIWNLVSEGTAIDTKIEGGSTRESGNLIYTKYTTVNDDGTAKLPYPEDYDHDGMEEEVLFSSHWSWLPALNNDPVKADGTTLWSWMASQSITKEAVTLGGVQTIVVNGYDWGPSVSSTIIKLDEAIDGINPNDIGVIESKFAMNWETFEAKVYNFDREVTNAYLSDDKGNPVEGASQYITVNMTVSPSDGSPFYYDLASGLNSWTDPYDLIVYLKNNATLTAGDKEIKALAINKTPVAKDLQAADLFDENTFEYEGTVYNYGVYSPAEDNAKNPLVIWLHGAGEGGHDVSIDTLGNKVTALVGDEIQGIMEGAYVLAPQCPTMWMDDGTGQYTQDGTSTYTEALMALIDTYVKSNPDIDTDRIYIGGCSNGGYMTMNMIMKYPTYFAAAYPICEAYADSWITDEMLEGIKDLPIWFTHAKNDPVVDPELHTVATYERLLAMGAENVHFSYYDDVHDLSGLYTDPTGNPYQYNGHWSWIYVFNNDPKLEDGTTIFKWLSQQTKAEEVVQPPKTDEKDDPKVDTNTTTSTPETGDHTMIYGLGSLMLLSAASYLYLRRKED